MTSLISIRGLRKTYRMGDENVHALAGVDLDFAAGEFVAILGPSGSGKSTLMHILGFMDTPSEGSIVFEGEEVARLSADRRAWYRSNRVGFVFQSFNLLPRLTVLENVALPLLYRERPDAEAAAAAIVGSPAIIFADEPTGNLDVRNVDLVLDLLGSLIQEGITVVLVTHDLSVAERARRVITMRAGLVQEDRQR